MPDPSMKTRATRLCPFVPSGPQFARSVEFFVAVGFEVVWRDQGLEGLRSGDAFSLLQDIDVPGWPQDQMIVFEVPDLDLYCLGAGGEGPAGRLPGRVPAAPYGVPPGTGDPAHQPRWRLLARAPGVRRRVGR
jgi:hypothetical protein